MHYDLGVAFVLVLGLFAPAALGQDESDINDDVKKCFGDLKKSDVFQCVKNKALVDKGPIPGKEVFEACGCIWGGTGSGTKIGERDIYACPGTPAFYVSPADGDQFGIVAADNEKYPACIFDLFRVGEEADDVYPMDSTSGQDDCLKCHVDPKNLFHESGDSRLPPPQKLLELVTAPPAPETETAPPAPETETAPPAPETETASPAPETETASPAPETETAPPAPETETAPPAVEAPETYTPPTDPVSMMPIEPVDSYTPPTDPTTLMPIDPVDAYTPPTDPASAGTCFYDPITGAPYYLDAYANCVSPSDPWSSYVPPTDLTTMMPVDSYVPPVDPVSMMPTTPMTSGVCSYDPMTGVYYYYDAYGNCGEGAYASPWP